MKKVVFLMPGQGVQYVGMAKRLCEKFPEAEKIFDKANEILGRDFKSLCFEGDLETLTRTENTQLAIMLTSIAAYKSLEKRYLYEPVCFAGHSLGEFSALVCANVLTLEDGIRLVEKRGALMQNINPNRTYKMVAIRGIGVEQIESICSKVSAGEQIVSISNYNSPNQIIISGDKEKVDSAAKLISDFGAQYMEINVKSPFHTQLMQEAANKFEEELNLSNFKASNIKVVSNVTAMPYEDCAQIPQLLKKQIVSPVQWIETMNYVKSLNVDYIIDIGPKTLVKTLALNNNVQKSVYAIDDQKDYKELLNRVLVPKQNISFMAKVLGTVVALKNNNPDETTYSRDVVEPYRKMEQFKRQLDQEHMQLAKEDVVEVMDLLEKIFKSKMTPKQERIFRIKQLSEYVEYKDLVLSYTDK